MERAGSNKETENVAAGGVGQSGGKCVHSGGTLCWSSPELIHFEKTQLLAGCLPYVSFCFFLCISTSSLIAPLHILIVLFFSTLFFLFFTSSTFLLIYFKCIKQEQKRNGRKRRRILQVAGWQPSV